MNRTLTAWLQAGAIAWGVPLHGVDWGTALQQPLSFCRRLAQWLRGRALVARREAPPLAHEEIQ